MKTDRARKALVFGGTGTVGREVLRGLGQAGVRASFTYFTHRKEAEVIERECGHVGFKVDLREAGAIREVIGKIADPAPDVFIHCAGIGGAMELEETSEDTWRSTMAVNCDSAFIACRELAAPMARNGGGDIVLVGALAPAQSFKVPVGFAASQGALSSLAMALGKELGPKGIRVNQVVLGFLDEGLSRRFAPELREDFKRYSALRRFGSAEEAARAIVWLALENTYVNGKVIPVNGGL